MNIEIRGENFDVTEAIRTHVEEKLSEIERYFNEDVVANAHVNMKVYRKNLQKVEVTIRLNSLVIRAEDTNVDVYVATDGVLNKLERQIRKYKTKVNRKSRESDGKGIAYFLETGDSNEDKEEEQLFKVKKRKSLELHPMSEEEAILQMNLVGHDFFLYLDDKTGNVSVVYKRNEDNYGVLKANK